ncbi:DUF397 domain-containing protein [Streptomyces sp. NPDC050617]|uniref:DUF397 domain-containing protein n=1 Tax=Streptomyces sp. NPDC050617 TaxID=3154628 RepID=UPI00344598C2
MSQLIWRKSSFSTSGQDECVEVAADASGRIRLRESDAPNTALAASSAAWGAFLKTLKADS